MQAGYGCRDTAPALAPARQRPPAAYRMPGRCAVWQRLRRGAQATAVARVGRRTVGNGACHHMRSARQQARLPRQDVRRAPPAVRARRYTRRGDVPHTHVQRGHKALSVAACRLPVVQAQHDHLAQTATEAPRPARSAGWPARMQEPRPAARRCPGACQRAAAWLHYRLITLDINNGAPHAGPGALPTVPVEVAWLCARPCHCVSPVGVPG